MGRSVVFEYWKELFGLVGGVVVVMIGLVIKRYLEWKLERKHKKLIYDWLYDKTKHLVPNRVGSPHFTYSWPSTKEISSAIDLTEERIKYICTIHNEIQRQEKDDLYFGANQELEERWAVRKFVRE